METDEDRDGPRNVRLFIVQPLDPADNLKELHCNFDLLFFFATTLTSASTNTGNGEGTTNPVIYQL
jgi:hypothetical protein